MREAERFSSHFVELRLDFLEGKCFSYGIVEPEVSGE